MVVLRCSDIAMMELMMIFEILEWGGRGMHFVKREEMVCGLWFSIYQNVGLLIIRILSSVAF